MQGGSGREERGLAGGGRSSGTRHSDPDKPGYGTYPKSDR